MATPLISGIERPLYHQKIIDLLGSRVIKVITGMRRVGKSYIARQVAQSLIRDGVKGKNIFMLNKEFTELDSVQTYKDLDNLLKAYLDEIAPKGKVYLFLDEIQDVDEWEKTVNSYSQDYTGDFEIFLTGSNSKMLSGELSTKLSGRFVILETYSLSFGEYIDFHKEESLTRQSYLRYLGDGGMPALREFGSAESKRNYVSSLKDTILLKDIVARHNIRYPKLLESLFGYLINNASNIISINNIANYYKKNAQREGASYETIAQYVGYMEEAFLVHRCERYDMKGKAVLSGPCKFYINDLCFHNYLYKGFGFGLGYSLENSIFLDLKRAGFNVYVGKLMNKEVDFVAIKDERKVYIQVAYTLHSEDPDMQKKIIQREYSPLEGIRDNWEKLVISLDESPMEPKDGIKNIQAWNLCGIL